MKKLVKILSVLLSVLLLAQFAAVGASARTDDPIDYLATYGGSEFLRTWLHGAMGSGLTGPDIETLMGEGLLDLGIFNLESDGNAWTSQEAEDLRTAIRSPLTNPASIGTILLLAMAVGSDNAMGLELEPSALYDHFEDTIFPAILSMVDQLDIDPITFEIQEIDELDQDVKVAIVVLAGEMIIWALDDSEWEMLVMMLGILPDYCAPFIDYFAGVLEQLRIIAEGLTVDPINFGNQEIDGMSQAKKIAIAYLVGELITLGLDDHLTITDYSDYRVTLHGDMGTGLKSGDIGKLEVHLGPGLIDLTNIGTQTEYDNLRDLIDEPFSNNNPNAISAIFFLAFSAAKEAWL